MSKEPVQKYTGWIKDGVKLSREAYIKLSYIAKKTSKTTPDYLIELGYTIEKIRIIKIDDKITYWKKDGCCIAMREYERLSKRAQARGESNTTYLKSLGYILDRARILKDAGRPTLWKKSDYYLGLKEYERLSKQAQARGESVTTYLKHLGYTLSKERHKKKEV